MVWLARQARGRTHRFRRPVKRYLDCKRQTSHSSERADYQQAIRRQHALTVAGDGGYGHGADVQHANSMIARSHCGKHLDTCAGWQKCWTYILHSQFTIHNSHRCDDYSELIKTARLSPRCCSNPAPCRLDLQQPSERSNNQEVQFMRKIATKQKSTLFHKHSPDSCATLQAPFT
jgi:hypothetical protein